MSTKKKHISLKVTIKNRKQINFVWDPLILPNFSRHTNLACKGVQIRSLTLHQFESLSIRIGFLFSIIIKNIFDLHYPWVTKIKQVEHDCVRLVLFIQTEGLVWNHRKVHGISRTATVWHQSLDCIVFCFSLIPYDTVC